MIEHASCVETWRVRGHNGRVACPGLDESGVAWHGGVFRTEDVIQCFTAAGEVQRLAAFCEKNMTAYDSTVSDMMGTSQRGTKSDEDHFRAITDLLVIRCPVCKRPQDPDPDGCVAVRCIDCGTEYCWLCMAVADDKNNNHRHAGSHFENLFPSERNQVVCARHSRNIRKYIFDEISDPVQRICVLEMCATVLGMHDIDPEVLADADRVIEDPLVAAQNSVGHLGGQQIFGNEAENHQVAVIMEINEMVRILAHGHMGRAMNPQAGGQPNRGNGRVVPVDRDIGLLGDRTPTPRYTPRGVGVVHPVDDDSEHGGYDGDLMGVWRDHRGRRGNEASWWQRLRGFFGR